MSWHRPVSVSASFVLVGLLLLPALLLVQVFVPEARAREFSLLDLYREEIARLVDTPGTSRSVAAGRLNPGAWPVQSRGGFYLGFEDVAGRDVDDVTGVLSLGVAGVGVRYVEAGDWSWTDATVGVGWGDRDLGTGLSWSWSSGDRELIGPTERLNLGTVARWGWGSLGQSAVYDFHAKQYLDQIDLGLRPFGPRLTLFGDFLGWRAGGSVVPWESYTETKWGYGVQAHLLAGLAVGVRADDGGNVGLRLDLAWDGLRPSAMVRYDDGGDRRATTYAVELAEGPSLDDLVPVRDRYPEISLKGPVTYRRYQWFDDRTRFLELLARINHYAENPRVEGVIVNLSGLRMDAARLWELRTQLAGLRAWDKKVLVYADRLDLPGYMLATVADELWIDPQGSLDLRGVAIGRSYYAAMLEKLGIGFEEWRFFRYKSAVESFARESFSDGAREQLQAVLDSVWETTMEMVSASRGISRVELERIVDEKGQVIAREAEELGLVDAVGDLHDLRESKEGAVRRPGDDRQVTPLGPVFGDFTWRDEEWGEAPRIAVLYAIGPCAMDSGIRGRALSGLIRDMREDPDVVAVVLRADSPGGDPLPSDLVARELRETAKVKPVIVSQGSVAGSGGYWISMDGDEIVASPYTITGSIGVISAHVYDDGIAERVGIDYDHIQRGRSADLYSGPGLPVGGLSLPHRPATDEERARVKEVILELYDEFVVAVAEGRGMEESEVREVAQGRIWTGADGREIGLVDELASLWSAIIMAKQAAGLEEDARVRLVEGPDLGLFPPSLLSSRLFGLRLARLWNGPPLIESVGTGREETRVPDVALGAEGADGLFVRPEFLAEALSEEQWSALPLLGRAYLLRMLAAPGEPSLMMEPFDFGAWTEGGGR